MERIKITNNDQTSFNISVFRSAQKSTVTFICIPAMGVRASYYENFALQLSNNGFNVIVTELRGHGSSSVKPSFKNDFGYMELLSDLDKVSHFTDLNFKGTNKFIIGHSLGGQIGSLFLSIYPEKFESIILITSCSVYYKGWKNLLSIKILLAGKIFYPISKILGYFPGNKIGFGGKEARTVMKDWSNTVVNGTYKLTNSNQNFESELKKVNTNILSISIENDYLASKQAVLNLHDKLGKETKITHLHVSENQTGVKGLNHFNWAKNPDFFVKAIKQWIKINHR